MLRLMIKFFHLSPHGLVVRTQPFQGYNSSSSLDGGTKQEIHFLLFIYTQIIYYCMGMFHLLTEKSFSSIAARAVASIHSGWEKSLNVMVSSSTPKYLPS